MKQPILLTAAINWKKQNERRLSTHGVEVTMRDSLGGVVHEIDTASLEFKSIGCEVTLSIWDNQRANQYRIRWGVDDEVKVILHRVRSGRQVENLLNQIAEWMLDPNRPC